MCFCFEICGYFPDATNHVCSEKIHSSCALMHHTVTQTRARSFLDEFLDDDGGSSNTLAATAGLHGSSIARTSSTAGSSSVFRDEDRRADGFTAGMLPVLFCTGSYIFVLPLRMCVACLPPPSLLSISPLCMMLFTSIEICTARGPLLIETTHDLL